MSKGIFYRAGCEASSTYVQTINKVHHLDTIDLRRARCFRLTASSGQINGRNTRFTSQISLFATSDISDNPVRDYLTTDCWPHTR